MLSASCLCFVCRVPALTVSKQITTRETSIGNIPCIVGFEVLKAVCTKMAVFWDVAPCSLVDDDGSSKDL
jgi:hypothetical protein